MDQAQLLALGKDLLLLISPLIAQGAIQKLGEDTAVSSADLLSRALGLLQSRFKSAEAQSALTVYQSLPQSNDVQALVAQQIVAHFRDHPAAIAELQELVSELRAASGVAAPQRSHTQSIGGNARVGVAVAGDVHGGISHVQQSGGVNFGSGNTIGRMGDVIAGDKIVGDRVPGDTSRSYGARKPADSGPEHIQHLIGQHTRRLRVLESQAAASGYNVRPEVRNEIEDIRAELARLQALLEEQDG